MSGETAPKPRLVLCPKCWQLLPESPNYDVYKCGGCGTTLQAKKRRSKAVSSETTTHETDATSGNALDPKADDKQYSNGEQLVSCQENRIRKESTSSSSGECSLDGQDRRGQIENGECNGEQLVHSLENGFREKETSSSSGEFSLNRNGGRDHIEEGGTNGEQIVTSQVNSFREKETNSTSRESSLNENTGRGQIEDGEFNGEQSVISQESGLRAKETSSSSGECSLNENGGRHQNEDDECKGEQPQPVISQENGMRAKATSSSSSECSLSGNGGRDQTGECIEELLGSSQENGLKTKGTRSSSEESSLDGNDRRDQIQNGVCNGEQIGQGNSPDAELENEMDINKGYSDEITHFEIEAAAKLMAEKSIENVNNTNLQPEGEQLSSGNVPVERAGGQLISALNKEDANDEKSAPLQVKSEVHIAGNDSEVVEELNNGNLILEGAEKELFSGSDREEVNKDKSVLVDAKPKVDINGSNEAGSEELNNRNMLFEVTEEDFEDPKHKQSDLVGANFEVHSTRKASTAKKLSTEEGSISHNDASSKTIYYSFDRVRSVDTFDDTSGTLGRLSKSSTTRSYHAYEGSVSSNDGVDEQFPNQYLDSFEGGFRKGKGLVNSMLHGDLETQHQSYFPDGNPHVPRDNRRNQNEVPETTRHSYAHWMRTKKDEFPPRIPHHRSGSQSGYESGSTSNQMIDEFYCSSSYLSPDSFDDPDQEKMKLLRMVYKLQNQLNRTSYLNAETNGRLSVGNHISPYQSLDLHERRLSHGLDHPRCDGICTHGTNCCQKHNFSQVPYLAEPTSSVHHVDHSCSPFCPQQWQCSAELPRRVLYQHQELCRPSAGHSCCSSHHSYPSSPQWIMTTNPLVHGHETKSCDQMYRPEVKKYFREKPNLARRHYRPVAGGAPFVTCHKCFKLLQLPADFLLFKRVCHQLKCGACQEVLKFSLQNGSHIVSCAPNALDPQSSSNLDDRNDTIDALEDHSSQADHVSYSDDYGHPVGKSYSSEGDLVSVTPLHPLGESSYDKPAISSDTLEHITEKENTASKSLGTSKVPVKTDELAVNSSNVSSEMEANLQPKSSPLHQLMGYSSPSQVVRGIP